MHTVLQRLLLLLTVFFIGGCVKERDRWTDPMTVYIKKDNWWPKKDAFVAQEIAVVRKDYLASVPHTTMEAYILTGGEYRPVMLNVLHPSVDDFLQKDKEATRALMRTIFTFTCFTGIGIMLIGLALQYAKFAGAIDIIWYGIFLFAYSVSALYFLTYMIYILVTFTVNMTLYFLWMTYRKNRDEKCKERLVISGERIKKMQTWDQKAKEEIAKLQGDTSKEVKRIKKRMKIPDDTSILCVNAAGSVPPS